MSWVRNSWLMVGFRFCYSVFSTYNFDTYQYGFVLELVSLVALRNLSVPQLSASPLGSNKRSLYGQLFQYL
jgi:hypothetical protein